jgi:hypothetical protein
MKSGFPAVWPLRAHLASDRPEERQAGTQANSHPRKNWVAVDPRRSHARSIPSVAPSEHPEAMIRRTMPSRPPCTHVRETGLPNRN